MAIKSPDGQLFQCITKGQFLTVGIVNLIFRLLLTLVVSLILIGMANELVPFSLAVLVGGLAYVAYSAHLVQAFIKGVRMLGNLDKVQRGEPKGGEQVFGYKAPVSA